MKTLLVAALAAFSLSSFANPIPCNLGEVKYFARGSNPFPHGYTYAVGSQVAKNDPSISRFKAFLKDEYPQVGDMQTLPLIDALGDFYPFVCTNGIYPTIWEPSEVNLLGTIKTYIIPNENDREFMTTDNSVLLSARSQPALHAFLLPVLKTSNTINIPKMDLKASIHNNLNGKTRLDTYFVKAGYIMQGEVPCVKGEVIFTLNQTTPENTYEIDGSSFTVGALNNGSAFSARVLVCK